MLAAPSEDEAAEAWEGDAKQSVQTATAAAAADALGRSKAAAICDRGQRARRGKEQAEEGPASGARNPEDCIAVELHTGPEGRTAGWTGTSRAAACSRGGTTEAERRTGSNAAWAAVQGTRWDVAGVPGEGEAAVVGTGPWEGHMMEVAAEAEAHTL